MRARVVMVVAWAAAGCIDPLPIPPGSHHVGLESTVVTVELARSNALPFDGRTGIVATAERDGGMVKLTLTADPSWPVQNTFLGFDKLYTTADWRDHPVVRVVDEGCDEWVAGGQACGWQVNTGGCTADGFGCFPSLASADPGGHGARTGPLVFYLAGDPMFLANDHGARFAVHGRFDGDCSGWFSDGVSTSVEAAPACLPVAEPRCELTVAPTSLTVTRGGHATAVVSVASDVPGSPAVTLAIEAVPPPVGLTFTLAPNPVAPPGVATLGVTAGELARAGDTSLTIVGTAIDPETGHAVRCTTHVSLDVVERPDVCGCP